MTQNNHWVSVWGNAVSVAENRPERYAKDITIRYPIHIPFSGEAIRLTFDNYCGTEPITLSKVTAFYGGKFYPVLFDGERAVTIQAGEDAVSDALAIDLQEGEILQVSFYLADFMPVARCRRAFMPMAMKRKRCISIAIHPVVPICFISSAMYPF